MTGAGPGRPAALLERAGHSVRLGAPAVSAAFLDDQRLAIALGDGRLALFGEEEAPRCVALHDGACLALAPDSDAGSILTGGDDGRLMRLDGGGAPRQLGSLPRRWIDPVAASRATSLIAFGAGRTVHLVDRDGTPLRRFEHPSTATGVAFDPRGRRLAVSHYGGVSLWWTGAETQQAKRLDWRGSHIGVAWSPDGRFVVTSMQEGMLHGWRLADGADMRMTGYAAKVRSMSWLPKGRYLATSGADAVICWPFSGRSGPMGRPPRELGWVHAALVTVVAAHPSIDLVAAGYGDGTVIGAHLDRQQPILIRRADDEPVSALAWSPDGRRLAIATEGGSVSRIGLADWRP